MVWKRLQFADHWSETEKWTQTNKQTKPQNSIGVDHRNHKIKLKKVNLLNVNSPMHNELIDRSINWWFDQQLICLTNKMDLNDTQKVTFSNVERLYHQHNYSIVFLTMLVCCLTMPLPNILFVFIVTHLIMASFKYIFIYHVGRWQTFMHN